MPNTTRGKFIRNYHVQKDGSEIIEEIMVDPVVNQPYVVGQADFANGTRFTIVREPGRGRKSGGFKVISHNRDRADENSYAGTLSKAWASIRYMAKIAQTTERSTIG